MSYINRVDFARQVKSYSGDTAILSGNTYNMGGFTGGTHAQFLGTVQGHDAVQNDEFITKQQLSSGLTSMTLDAVLRNGNTSSISATIGDLTVHNLHVSGTATTVDSQIVTVSANTITLNKGETGAGVTNRYAGLTIDRGTQPNFEILFDENIDRVVAGITGSTQTVAYLSDIPSLIGYVPYTGATQNINLGTHSITANSFIKSGGTSTQFLKADGTVDNTAYIPTGGTVGINNWVSGSTYHSNDIVKKYINGHEYLFVSNNDNNTTAPQLKPGIKPWTQASGTFIGAWNSGTTYNVGNIVSENTTFYLCLGTTTYEPAYLTISSWAKLGANLGNFNPSYSGGYLNGDTVVDGSNNVYTSNIQYNTFPLATVIDSDWTLINGNPYGIAIWGNSLVYGTGSNANHNVPSYISEITGINTYNGGVAGETSTQIKTRFLADPSKWTLPTIFDVTRNNYADTATVLADIAAMVGKLTQQGNFQYLILGATSGNYESVPDRASRATLNNSLASIYGDNYIDIWGYLLTQYNPADPVDFAAHAAGNIAPSISYDAVHRNFKGYQLQAKYIVRKLNYLLGNNLFNATNVQTKSIQVTGNVQPELPVKALELLYDPSVNKGYIEAYDRVNSLSGTLALCDPTGSTLNLLMQGGHLNVGTIDAYTGGTFGMFVQKGTGDVQSISSLPFSFISSKPTTLSGYGITDAYPLSGNPSNFLTSITIPTWSSGSTYKLDDTVKILINGQEYLFVSNASGNTTTPILLKGQLPWIQQSGNYIGAWVSGSTYVNGNIVTENGFYYKCIGATITSEPQALATGDWTKLGQDYGVFSSSYSGGYPNGAVVKDGSNNIYIGQLDVNSYPLNASINNNWSLINSSTMTVMCWGDSLTFGTGSSGVYNYPFYLSLYTGWNCYNGGVPGETSTQIKTRFLADPSKWKYPTIIWAGRNNWPDTTTVKADIAAMVAALQSVGNNRFLILGIISANGESNPNTVLDGLNSDLHTTYGLQFIDINAKLRTLYDLGLPPDIISRSLNQIPWSCSTDGLHLNSAKGYPSVASTIVGKANFLRGENNIIYNNVQASSLQITGNVNTELPTKSLELIYLSGLTYIQGYDRINNNSLPLTLQYVAGSELRLIEAGGILKMGDPGIDTGTTTGTFTWNPLTNQVKRLARGQIASTGGTVSIGNGAGTVLGANVNVDLPVSSSTPGIFGDASHVGQFNVNAYGILTGNSNVPIQITESQVTNLSTDLSTKQAIVASISLLQSYSGTSTVVNVTDSLTGGVFIYSTGGTANGFTTITATGQGSGYWLRKFNNVVYPEWFGAKGDGSTADHSAIQAAIDYATVNGLNVELIKNKTYKITSQVIITCNFDGYDSFITVSGSSVANAILVQANKTANTSALLSQKTIRFPTLTNLTKPTTGWTGQGNGITINNTLSCPLIQTNVIVGFSTNLLITANAGVAGNSNNHYILGRILDGDYNVVLQPNGVGAYVNENTFDGAGGILGYFNGTGAHAQLALLPNSTDNTSGPNSNHFYNIDFETDNTPASSPAYNLIIGGSFNDFNQCRFEFANSPGRIQFYNIAEAVTDNHIYGGYTFQQFTITQAGSSSIFGTIIEKVGRQTSIDNSYGTMANIPTGGATPYLMFFQPAKNLLAATFSDTDWLSKINIDGWETKNPVFNTVATLKAVGNTLFFGDGSTAIGSMPFLTNMSSTSLGTTTFNIQAGSTGVYNNGHLQIGATRIWNDGTGLLRFKGSVPTTATDGFTLGIAAPTAPLSYNTSTGVLSMASATTSVNGYLSSTDWTTFNNKAPATGAAGYIQNQNAGQQTTSKFWVSNTSRIDGSLIIGGGAGNGYILDVNAPTSTFEIKSTTAGNVAYGIFQNSVGTTYIGQEGSTGGQLLTGAPATASVLTTNVGGMYFGTSNVIRAFISNQGINAYIHTFLGSTSGAVAMQAQPVAGNYNFNLPATAGSIGQVLTSQGGGTSAMTWSILPTAGSGLTSTSGVFSVNYGTTSTTAAAGNDSRINNGQTAFSWGNPSGVYLPLTAGVGQQLTGDLYIAKSLPILNFIDTASSNKAWQMYVNASYFAVVETGVAERMRFLPGGFIGIGYNADPTSGNLFGVNGNGYFGGSSTATAFYQSSQRTLKTEIKSYENDALSLINNLKVNSFYFKNNLSEKQIGFVVDEVENINDEILNEDKTAINKDNLIGQLTKAVQQLSTELNEIKCQLGVH